MGTESHDRELEQRRSQREGRKGLLVMLVFGVVVIGLAIAALAQL